MLPATTTLPDTVDTLLPLTIKFSKEKMNREPRQPEALIEAERFCKHQDKIVQRRWALARVKPARPPARDATADHAGIHARQLPSLNKQASVVWQARLG